MKTRLLLMAVCVMVLSYNPQIALGDAGQTSDAECDISVTVDSIIEWDGAFLPIDLDAQEGHIIAQGTTPEGDMTLSLWVNCNVNLSADTTAASQLTHTVGTVDTLVTKYMLTFDGDGADDTGPTGDAVNASGSAAYVVHSSFLSTPLAITHVNGDGRVEVTLYVEASNDADNAADVGLYEATQTLTATWVVDN